MAFPDDLAKLAFEQSSKSLSAQSATVDNARTRFGILLAGGNVATAFLGKDAIARGTPIDGSPSLAFLVGVAAFVVFVGACFYGLAPRSKWIFDLSAKSVIALDKPPETLADMSAAYRYLAEWQEKYFDSNSEKLDLLWRAMRIAVVATAVELLAFGSVVIGGPGA